MISSTLRRLLRPSTVALAAGLVVLTALPAAADVPETWPEPDAVGILGAVLLFVAIPVLVFVVTTLAVYAPSIARGESLTPGPPEPRRQWLGGPRRSPEELAAPDDEDSAAGGAGGSW
ncbi:hypothetical protein KUV85_01220 [Nocardioides panacisoli]|uniref:hypothetical protein n=1 Tax=Nocardioides panacisoli TaxID=627624 RepID=UPI001C62AFE0|nr:hypothetical protein [Nocardioides panacisoli]QYJ04328.1 hypothetical protein KUV85_01220 [Nocardioides panacisoli]